MKDASDAAASFAVERDFPAALYCLKQAERLAPNTEARSGAILATAEFRRKFGDTEGAFRDWETIRAMPVKNGARRQANLESASYHWAVLGDFDGALAIFYDLLGEAEDPADQVGFLANIAAVSIRGKRFEEAYEVSLAAEELWKDVPATTPDMQILAAETQLGKGLALYYLGQQEPAQKCFAKAKKMAPWPDAPVARNAGNWAGYAQRHPIMPPAGSDTRREK